MLEYSAEQHATYREAINNKEEWAIQKFDDEISSVVNKIATEGWTLPADFGIIAIKVLSTMNTATEINDYLKQYYTHENCFRLKMILFYIQHSTIKTSLKNVYEQCWKAFQSECYIVCAISLLAIIEGVLSEFSVNKNDTRMMKVCQQKLNSLLVNDDIFQKHMWNSYNLFVRNLYQKSDFSKTEPDVINRHWLLHGRSCFDVTQTDCLRLINAVYAVCAIYDTEYSITTDEII